MKTRRPVVVAIECLLLLVGSIVLVEAIGRLQYRYTPSSEHESAFLRNYTPKPAIESFAFKGDPLELGDGVGGSAGREFVTTKRKIEAAFAIYSDMRPAAMNTLKEDLLAQLARNGSTIISKQGDSTIGFQFSYKNGASAGAVALLPFSDQVRSSHNFRLPEGLQEVRVNIVISEKWFSQDPATVQASLTRQ
jgi:hypothetical protein